MAWYRYSPAPGSGRLVPIVQIVLWHGSRFVRVPAIVDSGADSSLMNAEYIDRLGLDRSKAKTGEGGGAGGGKVKLLRFPNTKIEILFQGRRIPFKGCFTEFKGGATGDNLLGRADFFEANFIQFWDEKKAFSVDSQPPADPSA